MTGKGEAVTVLTTGQWSLDFEKDEIVPGDVPGKIGLDVNEDGIVLSCPGTGKVQMFLWTVNQDGLKWTRVTIEFSFGDFSVVVELPRSAVATISKV